MRKDVRLPLVDQWSKNIVALTQSSAIPGKIRIDAMSGIPGPRAAALEISAGIDSGRLLKAMGSDESALLRQTIPWAFTGDPIAYMHGRAVRLEAGWSEELSEVDIQLSSIGANPHKGGRWVFGKSESGATIIGGFSDVSPHWLVAGASGSGKSTALISAITQLSGDSTNRLILADCKHGASLGQLDRISGLVGPVAKDVDTTRAALSWSVTEMRRRYDTGDYGQRLVIICDEVQELSSDSASVEYLRILAAQGRQAGINIVLSSQHPVNSVFGDSTIRRNLGGRLALRVADFDASRVAIGSERPRADKLLGRGDGYIVTPGAAHRLQVAYVPQVDIDKLPRVDPALEEWPESDGEAAGTFPTGGGCFGVGEIGVSLITAAYGKGRPFLLDGLAADGLAKPGTDRARQLLALGRDTLAWLTARDFELSKIDAD